MTFGLTPAGFQAKTLLDILGEVQASELSRIDPGLDFSTARALGQFNGIFSEREAFLWELLRVVAASNDPDAAEGYLLEALSALTGTKRRGATRSLVSCTVNLDGGVTLPQYSVANVLGQPTQRFRSQASFGPTPAGPAANYSVLFEGESTGPVAANAGTLTKKVTAIGGWNSITNPLDAVLGIVQDTDTTLRIRRKLELQSPGGGTLDSLRSDLERLGGVEAVTIYENTQDVTVPPMPPHTIEAVVFDGVVPATPSDMIAQLLWDNKPAGATFIGSTQGNAIDKKGVTRVVKFTRPTVLPVYLVFGVATQGTLPSGAADLIKDQIVVDGNATLLLPGSTVYALSLRSGVLDYAEDLGYSWIKDVPTLTLGLAPAPVGTANLVSGDRQIPRLDTTRTTVNLI